MANMAQTILHQSVGGVVEKIPWLEPAMMQLESMVSNQDKQREEEPKRDHSTRKSMNHSIDKQARPGF